VARLPKDPAWHSKFEYFQLQKPLQKRTGPPTVYVEAPEGGLGLQAVLPCDLGATTPYPRHHSRSIVLFSANAVTRVVTHSVSNIRPIYW
jgi:hypothetical protein